MPYCPRHNYEFPLGRRCFQCFSTFNKVRSLSTTLTLSMLVLSSYPTKELMVAASDTRVCRDHPVCKPLEF